MGLRRHDGLPVLKHGLLELSDQPGKVVQGRHVVVLHAGRGVASLDRDVYIDELLATSLLQLIQLQSTMIKD